MDVKEKINSFFIFNSSFGPKEGEELQKILYFHPAEASTDARKIQVGLAEAVVKFMTTFSSEPCEALQTQTKRHIFFQPENGYWMVLVVSIPYTTKSTTDGHKSELVEPTIMKNFLTSAYNMFKMFMGTFGNIPISDIYTKCDHFFSPYVASISLYNDISEVVRGVSYLPLDKNSFLKTLCFIDLVEVNYPDFKCVSLVYNDQLIWNALASEDMLTLYQYLVHTLLPEQVQKEIQGGAVAAAERHGRFISPPDGVRTAEDLEKLIKVYLRMEEDEDTKQYYLVIYRTLSATICFTVDINAKLEVETFRSMDTFVGSQLSTIASQVSEQCALHALHSTQIATSDTKYIYYNRLNLALKISPPINRITPSTTLKPEVLSIITGIHADRTSLGSYGEIIIKTPDEYWITGKTSNDREFYAIIQLKNANLKEIADEVKRICETQMKGIFFYPT